MDIGACSKFSRCLGESSAFTASWQKMSLASQQKKLSNRYIKAFREEHKGWAFDELSALKLKGQWRDVVFKKPSAPLHLEIGPGNGKRFARLCLRQPESCFLCIELKYKPLIQTIRRVRKGASLNGRAIRCDARRIGDLFAEGELNNIYIHFPDPWLKKRRQKKHQLLQEEFCALIYKLQRPGSFLELKTDSEEYFRSSAYWLKKAGYWQKEASEDFYKKESALAQNFKDQLSQFELLFFKKNIPIRYGLFAKK